MEWVLVSPQIHSTFGSLGFLEGDAYHVNDNCISTLEEIYKKLENEDKNLRTFRRAVGFGQNIKKDLVPILIHVKDNTKILDLTIKILVNLTIPIECLFSVDEMSKNNVGRHTILELNNLLVSSKEAFSDIRVTKAIIDYINRIFENDMKLSPVSIDNVNNCLLLFRNILHIPEMRSFSDQSSNCVSSQNQILWNLFTQGIDKILLFLISSSNGTFWSVAIVQLIALIYKDQHIATLQKLLNMWFESSLSDSSEDNESNTSPPDQGSDDSSPMLTSDPTSDSSDNGGSGKSNENQCRITKMDVCNYQNVEYTKSHNSTKQGGCQNGGNKHSAQAGQTSIKTQKSNENDKQSMTDLKELELIASNSAIINNRLKNKRGPTTPLSHLICSGPSSGSKKECMSTNSEFSDCGYVTQLENRESISTSSNEDEDLKHKPIHQKPHGQKHKHGTKLRQVVSIQEKKEKRRKKLIKRGRTSIINVKGLMHHTPTDEDITNVLKEFTVDFLLKGYNSLIKCLHHQLIYNIRLQIDTSHFFWLLTYFLKFAAQLELDLEFVNQVLTFEIISYLTYEGVNLCEQIQVIDKIKRNELQSCLQRLHLVVTSIREFIQMIEMYKKISHLSDEDRVQLVKLQIRVCSTEDLRNLFILLLRHYQPDIHSKQYLQDLIITNHILLIFLDNSLNRPHSEETILLEHIQQFATIEVMHQYGLLLQDFKNNGEYVNDCVFTMMHHVGGDLDHINVLFQPNILKVFLSIMESGIELCEDWSDLLDYVINTFMKNPRPTAKIVKTESLENINDNESQADQSEKSWTDEEINNLHWCYMQKCKSPNVIENICEIYKEEGITKSHNSVVRQLFKQGLIHENEYRKLLICTGSKVELQEYFSCPIPSRSTSSSRDEIDILKEELLKQNMTGALNWLQKVLMEACFIKICFNDVKNDEGLSMDQIIPTMEPIAFYSIAMNKSIPVVPWNNEQSTSIHNQTFLMLLHRLGFHLPVDSGKLFVRIPSFWTADAIFTIARRLGPIDETSLKFSVKQVFGRTSMSTDKDEDIDLCLPDADFSPMDTTLNVQTKKISSVVEVREVKMPNISIKETKISTIEEKSNSWLDVVMKSKPSTIISNHAEALGSAKPHILDLLPVEEKMNGVSTMGPPMFTSPLTVINEQSQNTIPTSEENSLCETASVTSDLTRMYVSDEEERYDGTII